MAIFRKIHTSFWSDPFIQDLDNEQRLFYLYLLTNEKTKQCGIYEISKRQISFNLGIDSEKVTELIGYFVIAGKIRYSLETNEIAIKNWMKYNGSTSPKVVSCIKSELCSIKDRELIEYVNSIYTASQEEQEQDEEQDEEQKKEKEQYGVGKPTLDQLKQYMSEQGMNDFAEQWLNHYESNGWMVGKVKMDNWKASVRNWKLNNQKNSVVSEQRIHPRKFNLADYDNERM
jgi:hypothetical protein